MSRENTHSYELSISIFELLCYLIIKHITATKARKHQENNKIVKITYTIRLINN